MLSKKSEILDFWPLSLVLGTNHSTFISGHLNILDWIVRTEKLFNQYIRHMICKGNSSLAVIPTIPAGYSQWTNHVSITSVPFLSAFSTGICSRSHQQLVSEACRALPGLFSAKWGSQANRCRPDPTHKDGKLPVSYSAFLEHRRLHSDVFSLFSEAIYRQL